MPIVWLRVIRDAVPGYTDAGHRVLTALALRMSKDGRGYAAISTLAADTGKGQATVRRATQEAQRRGHLAQTRRGHRLGDGRTVANEWELTGPQPLTGELLSESQPLTGVSQPLTGEHPRGLRSKRSKQAASAKSIIIELGATEDEANAVLRLIKTERPDIRSLDAIVPLMAEDGELKSWLERVRDTAAKQATEAAYRTGWKCSRCANRNRAEATRCRQCGTEPS